MVASALTSCNAEVDPVAANSAAGILAVLCEYVFAVFTFVLVAVLWLFRSLGIATISCALFAMLSLWSISVSPLLMLLVGIAMFAISFIPLKPYTPQVTIAKKSKIDIKVSESKDNTNSIWKEIVIDLSIGLILLIIEYVFFVSSG